MTPPGGMLPVAFLHNGGNTMLWAGLALVVAAVAVGAYWNKSPLLGSALGGLAALLVGLISVGPLGGEEVAFLLIAGLLVTGGLFAVTAQHTFHSVLGLGVVLVAIGALFISMEQTLLGVVQILVYVGGILTLLVFAVMFVAGEETVDEDEGEPQ